MAISQKQIQDRAYRIAVSAGMDPHDSAIVDNAFLFEDLFPFALREAVTAEVNEGDEGNYKRTYSLTFAAGRVALPDTAMEEFLNDSQIIDPNDALVGQITSYQQNLQDFYFPANPQLGHYALDGNFVVYREPAGDVDDFAGPLNLKVVGIPDIPPSILTDLAIPTALAERTIVILAQMARGNTQAATQGGAS